MTAKLTRARDRASMGCRLFLGPSSGERRSLEVDEETSKRNSASVKGMSSCCPYYLDPDVMELVGSGSTQSPTVSQLGRMLSCQMIASNGWNLQLGDIRGDFQEADALEQKTRTIVLESSSRGNPRTTRWLGDPHSGKHPWFHRCASTRVEDI